MRYVDRAEAESVLNFPDLVGYLAACHREDRAMAGDILLLDPAPASDATFLCRAAWRSGKALGIKFGPLMPANRAKGLPTIITQVALFDGRTGQPVALLDGHPVTNWKTAADSALAQSLLARPDARSLLIVGAGTLAPYLARAHVALRPGLTEVRVWNRSPAGAEKLVALLADEGIAASPAPDLEAAVREADIVSTSTFSEEPLVRGAWLRPGAHLNLVGSYLPSMREADSAALSRGPVFVDTRDGTIGRCGELVDAFAAGVLSETSLAGDLYDLCAGGFQRRSPDEVTVFKNAGGGHLDLMTAEFIAKRLGLLS